MKGMQEVRNVNRLEPIQHCALGPTFPTPAAWKRGTELMKGACNKEKETPGPFFSYKLFLF